MGRYEEARTQIKHYDLLSQEIFVENFFTGRVARIRGWIAIAEKNYSTARSHLEESLERFLEIADDEQTAWTQAALALVAYQENNFEEARQTLIEALWTSIEIQSYIPMLFCLPAAALVLAREDPDQASFVYKKIHASPFLAQAPIFKDIVYNYLPGKIQESLDTIPTASSGPDPIQGLWEAAYQITSNWMEVWRENIEIDDTFPAQKPIH